MDHQNSKWKKDDEPGWNEFNPKNAVNKPMTYYANHERKKFTITLKHGYNDKKETRVYNYGYVFSNNTLTPKRTNYDFVVWKDNKSSLKSMLRIQCAYKIISE